MPRPWDIKAGTLEAIEQFVQMIKSFASMLNTKNAYEVAMHVGKQTNIVKELFNDKTTEGLARYENIQELLNSIKEWVDDQQNRSIIDEDGILIDNIRYTGNAKRTGRAFRLSATDYFTYGYRSERSRCRYRKADDDSCSKRT